MYIYAVIRYIMCIIDKFLLIVIDYWWLYIRNIFLTDFLFISVVSGVVPGQLNVPGRENVACAAQSRYYNYNTGNAPTMYILFMNNIELQSRARHILPTGNDSNLHNQGRSLCVLFIAVKQLKI